MSYPRLLSDSICVFDRSDRMLAVDHPVLIEQVHNDLRCALVNLASYLSGTWKLVVKPVWASGEDKAHANGSLSFLSAS